MTTTQQAALAVGVTVAIGAAVFRAPLWAILLGFAGGVLATKEVIESA